MQHNSILTNIVEKCICAMNCLKAKVGTCVCLGSGTCWRRSYIVKIYNYNNKKGKLKQKQVDIELQCRDIERNQCQTVLKMQR